jgi:hypothetical protein
VSVAGQILKIVWRGELRGESENEHEGGFSIKSGGVDIY